MSDPVIDIIIPAYNEEESIGFVIQNIPRNLVRNIVVCDNNSSDNTGNIASAHGALVVFEKVQGYGAACLKAMEKIAESVPPPQIIVFLDADFSDNPAELPLLIQPLLDNNADLVIGSRTLGKKENGAMLPHQLFGNWLATLLVRIFFGEKFTDLGPFRAIRYSSLLTINMQDQNYGWTVEMQVKAAKAKLRCMEVPVSYKKRIGISKISGTIRGSFLAGTKILFIVFKSLVK